MASWSETVTDEGENIPDSDEKKELQEVLTSVVYKRKTVPAKCMKLYNDIIRYEIKRLENAEVKLDNIKQKQHFMKMVHLLRRSKPPQICFNDLKEAEKKVLKCHQRLKEINVYLKKQKHSV